MQNQLNKLCLERLINKSNNGKKKGGGRNVDDQNVARPKISERRNGLFSWSLLRHHNVENGFWVDQNYDDQNVKNSIKIDFRRSDLLWRHR